MRLIERQHPVLINDVGKRRPGAIDLHLRRRGNRDGQESGESE